MATEKPTAFTDLPANAFPVTLEYLNRHGIVIRTEHIEGPGVMEVPPLATLYGPIGVRISYANGKKHIQPPPGGWASPPSLG